MYFIWDTDQIYTSGDSSYQLAGQIEKIPDRIKLFAITKTDILLTNVFLGICKQGASDLSWTLQPDAFFYLFLIHSVFVYLEAIKFVGTLILAISVESLAAKSGRAEYSRSNHYSPPNQV